MAAVNLITRASAPLPFYIARATGAHQLYGLDAPDQGANQELTSRWAGEINSNILPLDIFLHTYFLYSIPSQISA